MVRKIVLLTIIIAFPVAHTFAQIFSEIKDSIPLDNRGLKGVYKSEFATLKFRNGKSVKTALPVKRQPGSNFTEGLLTLTTGIRTSSKQEILLFSQNELIAKEASLTWQIPLFFNGEYVIERDRIENEDGSYSLESSKGYYIDWHRGAIGLIIENTDTIGEFVLVTDLQFDPEGEEWMAKIRNESTWVSEKLKKYDPNPQNYDFVIEGMVNGAQFEIYHSGNHYRSLILVEEKPEAVFQSEPDFIILGKKNKLSPYLLVEKNTGPEIEYFFRLAILSRLISKTLLTDYYKK